MTAWRKLGVIAGGGELPVLLAQHCADTQRPYFVARIAPFADAALEHHPGATHSLGAMGERMQAMREAGCDAVVLVGQVSRPDIATLKLDDVAQAMLPALLAALPLGDDAVLRAVLDAHERAGFRIVGAETVMADLLAPAGAWGAIEPSEKQKADIAKGAKIAAMVGVFDIGQGVVVCDGLVLAVEAQEGTDAMLARVAGLPRPIRGAAGARRGALVKRPKPIQDLRIDLPTIGVRTLEGAAHAGLAGVAVEERRALAVRRAEIVELADRFGMFVYGFRAEETDGA